MLLFIDYCSYPWLFYLLSGLLGLLLGWLIWGKFRQMVSDLQDEVSGLKTRIAGLETDLDNCRASRAELDSKLALMEGQLREASGGKSKSSGKKSKGKGKDKKSDVSLGAEFKSSDGIKQGIVSDAAAGAVAGAVSTTGSKSGGRSGRNIYGVLSSDNLQIVEGIGPKMDEVLKSEGISSWAELAGSTPESLRALLDKVNPTRYRIIDPTTWPEQARLANDGNWEDLISYQKKLDTGRSDKGDGVTDSKVEKILIKLGALKRWKQDDLKAVEGIGPKIEGLLKADGIDTWRKLANASVDTIQGILDKAGPRYRLADPGTWPKQAEMAAEGRWDDLDEYQEFLQGGK